MKNFDNFGFQSPNISPSFCYTIIGNGRAAKHTKFYLQSQNIRVHTWNRKQNTPEELLKFTQTSDVILLLIKDSAIESFVEQNPILKTKTLVHFSGSLVVPNIVGLHPLMTFSDQIYSLDFYKKIPFISERCNKDFKDIFPQLSNPSASIDPQLKPLYHSFCVMSGNFTTLLWKKFFDTLKEKFELSPEMAFPFLEKITENLKNDYKTALTGPLARRDVSTLKANLNALEDDSFVSVYRSFVAATSPELLKEIDNDHT